MEEPAVDLGTGMIRVPVTFFIQQPDYGTARDALIVALAGLDVELALECGLRHMIVAMEEECGPAEVNFNPS